MSLRINAQFNLFVDFAKEAQLKGKMSTIARISDHIGGPALAGCTITTTKHDRLSALWRSDKNQKANNDTRTLFRQTVINIFGGESLIPQEVKTAMELENYGRGKPLTARRILAVKAAIDQVAARIEPGIAQAKENANAEGLYNDDGAAHNAQIDNLISTMVTAAAGDKDALEVAIANVKGAIVNGEGNLRTPEKVKEKMESLLSTMSELKNAAKGNQAMIAAGKSFLKALKGKDIPEGLIGCMVAMVKKANIGAIKSISSSSSGIALHKATLQIAEITDKAMNESGADTKLIGADEKVSARNLAAALVIARCNDSTKRRIASAFSSENAKTLRSFYIDVSNRIFDTKGMSFGLADHTSKVGAQFMNTFEALNESVQTLMGVPSDQLQRIGTVNDPDYDAIDSRAILASLIEKGRERGQIENAAFLKDAVGGDGQAADAIRKLYGNVAGPETSDAKGLLKDIRKRNVTAMLNRNLCTECRKFASGNYKNTFFYGDLINVNLQGGKTLSHDFETARDELASFVTNGAKTKYADLSKAEQTKTHIIMSLLTQESELVVESGEFLAISQDGKNLPCTYAGGKLDKRGFSLSISENGSLKIACGITKNNIALVDISGAGNKNQSFELNPGSNVKSSFELVVKAKEFDRLANLDFTKYDDSLANAHVNDPTVRHPYLSLKDHMGDGFGFSEGSVSCTSEFKMTLA